MTDLPCCRLCKAKTEQHETCVGTKHCCSNITCTLNGVLMTEEQWRRLMYVPEKKPRNLYATSFDTGRTFGYNEAIDDLEKGGQNG